jgi:hypothetical protein
VGEIEKSLDKLAEEINAEHRAFASTFRKSVEHGIRAGELLAQAKSQCQHGAWLPWLEANFEGAPRTAQEYMRLHNHRDEIRAKTRDSAHLSVSGALKEIAAPTPHGEAAGNTEPDVLRGEVSPYTPAPSDTAALPEDNKNRGPGAIEQLQASPEGREGLAKATLELAEGQARDRVLGRISDLSFLLREVPPEDVARDVVARHVGEAAENAVLGRPASSRNYDVENAQRVHAWLGELLRVIEEADRHLRDRQSEAG